MKEFYNLENIINLRVEALECLNNIQDDNLKNSILNLINKIENVENDFERMRYSTTLRLFLNEINNGKKRNNQR